MDVVDENPLMFLKFVKTWTFQINIKNFIKRFAVYTMQQDNYIHFPLLTVGEAAKYLGVGRKIVYQLIEFGQIQSVRENRAILIEKRSLDLFRQSGQIT